MPHCKRCGAGIYWDPARKTESGKWVPIDEETDEPHDCPESDWNSGRGSSGSRSGIDAVDAMSIQNAINNMEDKISELNKNMLKLILEIKTVQSRIEGQMPLFPTTANITAKEVSEPILDPARLTEEG
jgi:hypothetical protein